MKLALGLQFGGLNQLRPPPGMAAGQTILITPTMIDGIATSEEDDLPLISTTTPVASATEVEIAIPAGYDWFELRWGGVDYTTQTAADMNVKMKGATLSYVDNGPGGNNGSANVGFLAIAREGDFGGAEQWYTQSFLGDAQQAVSGERPTFIKLTPNADTFNGTGKIWLHGIPS